MIPPGFLYSRPLQRFRLLIWLTIFIALFKSHEFYHTTVLSRELLSWFFSHKAFTR